MSDSILSITDSILSITDSSQASSFINEAKGVIERRPVDAPAVEYRLILDLIEKIKHVAPHMAGSFVLNTVWWEDNKFKLGIQMFKCLLFQSIENTAYVFSGTHPRVKNPPLKQCQKAIEVYNTRVQRVHRKEKEDSARRKQRCSAIYTEQFQDLRHPVEVRNLLPVPNEAVTEMDDVFEAHYRSLGECLLFGRMDEMSQLVNTAYAKQVAKALGKIDLRYQTRAILCLHPLYGKGAALPLMTHTSVEAMWNVCESYYYTVQLKTFYRWIEPFPEVLDRLEGWLTYAMHWFLRPKEDQHKIVFSSFYQLLMELSPQFYVVALLHEYLAQDVYVADFVRDQLITNDQKDEITKTFRKIPKRWRDLETDYDKLLNFSALDWYNENEVENSFPRIRRAMFDLMLGDETRRIHLNRYEEVHTIRTIIHQFYTSQGELLHPRCEQGTLWWDEIKVDTTPRKHWVSPELAKDKSLGQLVRSWSCDNYWLQQWLRGYERAGMLKNNRLEQDVGVFSESSAVAIMDFAKAQAEFLDQRRRLRFANQPHALRAECEQLGLFRTALPRFSQVFFYEFDNKEITAEVGQSMESKLPAPVRAARAYLQSGRRFQSSCGISDIWYHHVELNAGKFMEDPPPLPDLSPVPSVYPGPDEDQIREREPMFQWAAFHKHTKTSEIPARNALPANYVLVPSSSPLARAVGHNVPQAKGDLAGKKGLHFKRDEAVNSKSKAVRPKPTPLHLKPKAADPKPEAVGSNLKTVDLKHKAVDSKPRAGGSAIHGSSGLHAKVTGKKQAPVEAERAPDSANGARGSPDWEDYLVDDYELNSSLLKATDNTLDELDTEISDERKEGKMKQGGDEGKAREFGEHASNDDEITPRQPSGIQGRIALKVRAPSDEENPVEMKQAVDKGKKRQLEADDIKIAPLRATKKQKQVALGKLVNKRMGGS